MLLQQLRTASILLLLLTIITGLFYPVAITAIVQILFPWQASGSLIKIDNKYIGSALIGQNFTDVKYFWGRPSATKTYPYNATSSSGSNLSTANPILLEQISNRVLSLHVTSMQDLNNPIPVDLVTASASGLDPHISPLAAFYQIPRIAKARGIPVREIKTLVLNSIEEPTFGILGEPRVNILKLNIALDKYDPNIEIK